MTWQLSRIGKQYAFSAAHFLPEVDDGHPCKRLHGHNYVVEIEIRSETSPNGFCAGLDFKELDRFMNPIIDMLDHQLLNDVEGLENPTAEIIAEWILKKFPHSVLFCVKVWETPKCWAIAVNKDGLYHKTHRE